jgi:hypothetical protein
MRKQTRKCWQAASNKNHFEVNDFIAAPQNLVTHIQLIFMLPKPVV